MGHKKQIYIIPNLYDIKKYFFKKITSHILGISPRLSYKLKKNGIVKSKRSIQLYLISIRRKNITLYGRSTENSTAFFKLRQEISWYLKVEKVELAAL